MRTKATLFLFVLVVALGAVAYYFKEEMNSRRVWDASRTNVLGPDAVDLDFLEIEFADTPTSIVFEKRATGWELVQPVRWPANYFAVNRLLSQLQHLERETSFPVGGGSAGQTLADYGLDPAEGVLTYGRRGERHALLVGRVTDVGNRLYVRPQDHDRVYVVNKSLRDSLKLSIEAFRSPSVFSLPPFEVRSWNVQLAAAGNLRIWLSRDGDRWKLETPVQARADKAAVEVLMQRILGTQVVRFETGPSDLNLLRLATPDFIVAFEGSGRREALLIGARAPGQAEKGNLYFAKLEDNPTVFTVEADFLDELSKAQVGLRERRILDFEPARVQSISILQGGLTAPILLQKLEDGQWQVVARSAESGSVTMPGDVERVEALITELAELRAVPTTDRVSGFVSDAPSAEALATTYFLARPLWQVAITQRLKVDAPDTRTQTLLLGGTDVTGGNRVFARIADAPSVYLVDRAIADDLSAEPRHFRNRQLQRLPEGARLSGVMIKRLVASSPEVNVTLSSTEQTWAEALENESETRRTALLALITQLRNLRAKEIAATEFSSSVPNETGERPWTWLLESTVNLEGGAGGQTSAFRIYLDDYTGGTTLLAASPDLNVVFEADQAFIDAFGPLVFHRDDPGPPPPGADKPPGASSPPEVETPDTTTTPEPSGR